MEVNLNTPIVLEFYGLPGCGKSTISHKLADNLRSKGLSVWEPSYEIDRKFGKTMRKVVKFAKLVSFAICSHRTYKGVSGLVKANGYQGMSALRQLANIAHKIDSYKMADRWDVTIWDEGLVQASISLAVNGSRNASENESHLMLYTGDVKYVKVYTKVDKDTALERMKGRSTYDSRVEKMASREDQIAFLEGFETACESIVKGGEDGVAGYMEMYTVGLSLDEINKRLLEGLKWSISCFMN